ncbi:MAG: hypothetical protein KJ592_01835 [Nanoarchaeota archaeon]|nr:hypothetical protein [Nanoarchaeota archaeon]
MEQIRKFTLEFFRSLKADVKEDGDVLVVSNVPKSFEDLFGKISPYQLCFSGGVKDCEFVGKGSAVLAAMTKYLEGSGKATLLKIDFDTHSGHKNLSGGIDPEVEIFKRLDLKNCEIANLVKKNRNNFFSRFTFMTTFRYLNESEQIVNEVYVHDGKVVNGSLDGYFVTEGSGVGCRVSELNTKKDYEIAREKVKELLKGRTAELGEMLSRKVDVEIARIKEHYGNQMRELGGDLGGTLEKVKEVELKLRTAEDSEKEGLRARLERLRNSLVKIGDDDSHARVLKEQEFTIKDVIHKYSLNVDNKLVNTTVIYYPVYSFRLCLKESGVRCSVAGNRRFLEMSYDPLTRSLGKIFCESCKKAISRLNLCSAGHISCDECLDHCSECGKVFCANCLKRSCSVCAKVLCKNCTTMCLGCGKYVCRNHMRKDCVTGDERCVNCLRVCLRCHGMAQERYFGEARDGSKVCSKCLGKENLSQRLKFSRD